MDYKPPKELKRFQATIVLAASAALVFGLWSFGWYVASAWVKNQVTDWVTTQKAHGAIAAFATMETSGFPSRITLTLTEPHYQGPLFGKALRWQGETLRVTARPWTPWRLAFNAPGKHKLGFGDQDFAGAADVLRGAAVLGARWPEELDLQVQGLRMKGSGPLEIGDMQLALRHDPSATASASGLQMHVQANNVVVPGGLPQPMSDRVQVLDFDARLTGEVLPGDFRERLPAWRDSGGALDVERLKFRSGSIGLAAAGTAALDKSLQPQGAFTAKIEGLFQVLEILRAKGVMSGSEAVVATMGLSALSTRPKDGGAPSINMSVTVQDNELSLGPLKIMKMPKIDWGFPATPEFLEEPSAPEPAPRDYKDVKPVI